MDRSHRAPSRRVGAGIALALLLTTVVGPASSVRGVHVQSARHSVLQLSGAIGRLVRPGRSAMIVPSVDPGEVPDERDFPHRDAVPVRAVRVMPSPPARLSARPRIAGEPQYLRI